MARLSGNRKPALANLVGAFSRGSDISIIAPMKELLLVGVTVLALFFIGGVLGDFIDLQNSPPSASFATESQFEDGEIRAGYAVQFYSRAKDAEDEELHYYWTFGDRTSSDEANPPHIFRTPGEYQVELLVTDAGGKTARDAMSIRVRPSPPVASFDYSPIAPRAGEPIHFTDTSSHPGGHEIVSKAWHFKVGHEGLEMSVPGHDRLEEYVYDSAGTYMVRLVVQDDQGLTSEVVKEVVVGDLAATIASLEASIRDLSTEVDELRVAIGGLSNSVERMNGKIEALDTGVRDAIERGRFNVSMVVQWLGILLAVALAVYTLREQRKAKKP